MKMNFLFRLSISFLALLFTFSSASAQKPVHNNYLQMLPDEKESAVVVNNMKLNQTTGIPLSVYNPDYQVNADTPEKMARQYLSANFKLFNLSKDLSELRYVTTTETPVGYHVHFLQYIGEYPVLNSSTNITISRDNKVIFVSYGIKSGYAQKQMPDLQKVNVTSGQAMASAKMYLNLRSRTSLEKTETAVYYNKGTYRLAQVVTIVPAEEIFGQWEIMIDAQTGEIFRVEDKACYYGPDDPTLVDGSGYVFDPDPLTHARATYGSTGFVDNNDLDSDSLTAHRVLRTFRNITLAGGIYTLNSPYAQITDFESPSTGLHTTTTGSWSFTRSDDNFEAANVWFQIDNSMRWINDSLGIPLHPFQYTGGVKFDPHGLSGDDNSHYIPASGSIAYGDGGVDDAEDLGVVLHELGHGIHDWLTAGALSQVEGLSEGCGDYWCTSYIRSTGFWTPAYPAYNWVFIWDGHNPFWAGRIVNYTAHYPEGLTGTIHTDGQMWASSLMSIWNQIGRVPTDKNFLEALSMCNGSSGQDDAAQAFIVADQTQYGGSHLSAIYSVFTARGYVTGPIQCNFAATPTGGPAPLTVNFTDQSASSNPITSWQWDFDNNGTVDATTQNPSWIYTNFGIYTVKLTVSDGTYNASMTKTDYINVTDPNQVTDSLFFDAFSGTLSAWTVTTTSGTCGWEINVPPYPNTYTLPSTSAGGVLAADVDDCGSGSTMNSTATITQTFNCTIYSIVKLDFDNDWNTIDAQDEAHVEVSTDGGTTWTGVWDQIGTDIRTTHESVNLSSLAAGKANVKVRFRSVQPGWDWWWVVDNVRLIGQYVNLQTFQLTVNVTDGWNLVAVPGLHPTNQNVDTWWSYRDQSASVFGYNNGYEPVTVAAAGKGYWMKHTGARVYNTGDEWPAGGIQYVAHNPVAGAAGWNLFGGYEQSIPVGNLTTTPPGLISGSIYKYNNGYEPAVSIDPGYGYWVKLTGAGSINFPTANDAALKTTPVQHPENSGKIIITDKSGRSYTLYTANDKLNAYELPPYPPQGMFDIRFSSQRYAEDLSTPKAIEMSGVEFPVNIRAEGTSIILSDETGKEISRINNGGEVTVSTAGKLYASENVIPKEYSLNQNYPNPFNPATMIRFSLPEDVQNVKVIIYNALGEKVNEIVNTALQAGTYTYNWNAGNLGSGIYICQLVTNKFMATRKMMLLK